MAEYRNRMITWGALAIVIGLGLAVGVTYIPLQAGSSGNLTTTQSSSSSSFSYYSSSTSCASERTATTTTVYESSPPENGTSSLEGIYEMGASCRAVITTSYQFARGSANGSWQMTPQLSKVMILSDGWGYGGCEFANGTNNCAGISVSSLPANLTYYGGLNTSAIFAISVGESFTEGLYFLFLPGLQCHPFMIAIGESVPSNLPEGFGGIECLSFTSFNPRVSITSVQGLETVHFAPITSECDQPGSPIQMKVGAPVQTYQSLNMPNSFVNFTAYETFPINVTSASLTSIELESDNSLFGTWIGFKPDVLTNVGPSGAAATMIVAGSVNDSNPRSGTLVRITASGEGGAFACSFLNLESSINVAMLSSPGAIISNTSLQMNPGGASSEVVGVVYAPQNASGSISVNLSILGLYANDSVKQFPPWISAAIPVSSFTLQANSPYYFVVEVNVTSSAPVQNNYSLAVQDTIDGQSYTTYFPLIISEPPSA